MNKSVVVYGPAGCGKTVNSRKLAAHFGVRKVKDWAPGDFIPNTDHLLLSQVDPRDIEPRPGTQLNDSMLAAKTMRRVYSFTEAAQAAGVQA